MTYWIHIIISGMIVFFAGIWHTYSWMQLQKYKKDEANKKMQIKGDYVAGNKSKVIETQGDYISGDKVSYNTYVTYYTKEGRSSEIVSDATLTTFFRKYQSTCLQLIHKIPANQLEGLPGFLRMSYNLSIVVSNCHGIGFEYTVPSEKPEIILTQTSAPIEKYYFTQYTNHPDFPKTVTFYKITAPGIALVNLHLVGGEKAILVEENADVQLNDFTLRYSKEEDPKSITYLWLFGSNSTEYWNQLDPVQLANENTIRLIQTYKTRQAAETSYNLYRSRTSK